MIDGPELKTRFTYHEPRPEQLQKYVAIRSQARRLAQFIVEMTPESREQSLAITKLEEVVMWANAAIARRS